MATRLFYFSWPVFQEGYSWREAPIITGLDANRTRASAKKQDLVLTSGMPWGATGIKVSPYNPFLIATGLFRKFAETKPTQDEIKAFADAYGLLGDPTVAVRIPLHRSGQPDAVGEGERRAGWVQQIALVKRAVELWDMIQREDLAGLAQCIKWDGRHAVFYDSASAYYLIAFDEESPERLAQYQPGDLTQPALAYLQHLINEQLTHRVSSRLLWDAEHRHLGVHTVPTNLLGVIWLQFAQAIEGDKKFRQCLQCRTWFEVSPEIARTNRRYCSDACRLRAYRTRKQTVPTASKKKKKQQRVTKRNATGGRRR